MRYIFEILIWLMIEVTVNLAGLDQLGNYSEFVFAKKNMIFDQGNAIIMVI